MDQLDLFGNPARQRVKRAIRTSFASHCYKCGRRIPDGQEIPVALHTDYCRTCYDLAMREASEKGGSAAPSPEARDFLEQAQSNPAFNAMIERLADE